MCSVSTFETSFIGIVEFLNYFVVDTFSKMAKLQELLLELHESPDDLILDKLHSLIQPKVQPLSLLSLGLIDKDLLDEVRTIVREGSIALYFGNTLRDIKCVIKDANNSERVHELFINYKGPKKITIVSVSLPHSSLQDKEYSTLEEIITAYKNYINSLASYLYELEHIDRFCSVMEPLRPSFKDEYRRILLDDRTWLHVEVTTAGLATNIHLVGQSDMWHDKLQSGLLSWDNDKGIVDNIMSGFDITEFPVSSHRLTSHEVENVTSKESPTCGICLCDELPDDMGLPLPLCQNPMCGVYFHRNCLYQWLVACSGSRPPAFGVSKGACPTCLQPIACSEKDS